MIPVAGLIDWAEVSPPGISGIPGRVNHLEEFIKYAQKQKGVVFMRKDEIASVCELYGINPTPSLG